MSQQINLFNPIFLTQKKYFSAVAMAQALGLILLGALALSAYSNYQYSGMSKQAAQISSRAEAVRAQLATLNGAYTPPQKNRELAERIARTDAGIKSMQQAFDILKKGDIGDAIGYSGYLRAFSRQIVSGVWLTGFSIVGAGREIALQGRALHPDLVPAYFDRLKNETILQGKTFSSLDMQLPKPDPAPSILETGSAKPKAPPVTVPIIEFELRSSGVVKAMGAPFATMSTSISTPSAVAAAGSILPAQKTTLPSAQQPLGKAQ